MVANKIIRFLKDHKFIEDEGKPPLKRGGWDGLVDHFRADGTSGTLISGGYYDEEYLNKLQGVEAAETWDKMRRSDAQIAMLLGIVKNPILSADWFVEAVDETPEEMEIKDFAQHLLFEDMGTPDGLKRQTWKEFLENALSFLDFGFSMFEVTHKIVVNNPRWGTYHGISQLGWRSPKTIYEWWLRKDGSIEKVRQQTIGDLTINVNLDGRFLMVFSNRKEGDNYEGISALRPIYGNWFRKNTYQKIQAIGTERAALGVPVGKLSPEAGNDAEQKGIFKTMLQSFVSHQQAYMMLPHGFEVSELKISHDAEKVQSAIDAENREMSKAFMANFMELGMAGSGGSFALGSDLSDIFLSSIEIYAEQIIEKVNERILKPLIIAKYGVRDNYPKLKVSGINDKAGAELATAISQLMSVGAIKPSERLEAFLHKSYGLPDIEKQQQEDKSDGAQPDPAVAFNETKCCDDENHSPAPDHFTLAERTNVSKFIDDNADVLAEQMAAYLAEQSNLMIDKMLGQFKPGTVERGRKKVLTVPLPGVRGYNRLIFENLVGVSAEATREVLKELSLTKVKLDEFDTEFEKLPKDTQEKIKTEIALIVAAHYADLEKNLRFTANKYVDVSNNPDELFSALKSSQEAFLKGPAINTGSVNFVSSITNQSRYNVFENSEVANEIESFVFRNPAPVSAICKQLNGRVFTKDEYMTSSTLPPLHHNCKSYIQAQTTGGKGNKKVNPLGLTLTGTDAEVQAALKSATF